MQVKPGVTSKRCRCQTSQRSLSSQRQRAGARPATCRREARSTIAATRRCWSAAGTARSGVMRGSLLILNAGPSCSLSDVNSRFARFGIGHHRAELQHHELPAAQSAPLLTEENRPRRGHLDRHSDQAANSGDSSSKPTTAPATSIARFHAGIRRMNSGSIARTGRSSFVSS